MRFKGLTKGFFILILVIVSLAFFDILAPYFSAVFWASILAVIFHPVKNKVRSLLGERNGLASLLTLGIICLIVFTPLIVILSSLAIELNVVYTKLQHTDSQFPEVVASLFTHLPDWARNFLVDHNLDNATQIQQKLSDAALKGGQYLAGSAFLIGKGTFGFAISFGIMIYLLFFLLKDGPYLVRQILDSLPLSDFVKQHLFAKFAAVSRAVGSEIIWVPAAIFLFATQQLWQGFFIVGFFVIIVGLVDNILRPLLVGKDTKMPDYLILISTLGGMEIYGINGFVIGPLIAALFIACWNLLSGRDHAGNSDEIDETFIEEGKNPPDL